MTTENNLIRLDRPKYYTRQTQLRADQGYGIGRTALIRNWKITTPGIKAILKINNEPINIIGLDGINFNLSEIREKLREIIPETSEENALCNIESVLFGTQLLAVEHYRYFPTKCLFDYIFTADLCVTFEFPELEDIPDKIDIEEECVFSEIQLLQRLKAGETLESMETKIISV